MCADSQSSQKLRYLRHAEVNFAEKCYLKTTKYRDEILLRWKGNKIRSSSPALGRGEPICRACVRVR